MHPYYILLMFAYDDFDDDGETMATSNDLPSNLKDDFKKNKRSGLYQYFDSITGQLRETG